MISSLRNAFREEVTTADGVTTYRNRYKSFNFDNLLKYELPGRKSLAVTEKDVDHFLSYRKGPSSFMVLSLLYPNLRYQEVSFHQDHLHPAAGFTDKAFDSMGLTFEERTKWLEIRDCVPNLQLLGGRQNESKNATSLQKFIGKMRDAGKATFMNNNYIPENVDLDFTNFITFFEQRRAILREELLKVLAINNDLPANLHEDFSDIEPEDDDNDINDTSVQEDMD